MIYVPTIGLEVHIELKTATKMFCGCPNEFDESKPNANTCPVCLGHPGILPTINKEAVFAVARLGLALGGKIASKTYFDRKSYFYPDLPKGYQISQYEHPIVSGGDLLGIRIRRVHLEEDAGKLVHKFSRSNPSPMNSNESRIFEDNSSENASFVDFNRAGVPLAELVTEPDIKNAEEAVRFAKELRLLVRYLGISDADMEKGHMRIEANISLSNPSRINSNKPRIMLKEESYKLMNLLFEVHNKLGPIYKEKNYQDAIEEILKRERIPQERERPIKLKFENLEVSDFFADFIIDNKILLEIKAKPFITNDDVRQASRYIKSSNLPLAIVVNFKKQKLESRRIVNPIFENDSSLFEDNSRDTLGTKVEVKNINSFKAVGAAIDYELKRQEEVLENGGMVMQETRGWDDEKLVTVSQRGKESAHDYRYFPEPDLPPIEFKEEELEDLGRHLPELPEAKRKRLKNNFSLSDSSVETLVGEKSLADYFEAAGSELAARTGNPDYALLANYLLSDLRGLLNAKGVAIRDSKVPPEHLGHLVALLQAKRISSKIAKDLLIKMVETGEDPETLMQTHGVSLIASEADLLPIIKEVIAKNPKAALDYKSGKEEALQFLFGQAMGKTRGQADPEALRALLTKELSL